MNRAFRSWLPREHGAWAILAVSYFTGAFAGAEPLVAALFFPLALALFVARRPVVTWIAWQLRRPAPAPLAGTALAFALAAAAGAAMLLFLVRAAGARSTLLLSLAALSLLALVTWRSLGRRDRSLSSEMAGLLLVTLSAPAAYFLAGGPNAGTAVTVWLLASAYFATGVLYVRLRLRGFSRRRRRRLKLTALVYVLVSAAAIAAAVLAGLLPWPVLVAFAPLQAYVLFRAAFPADGNIRGEGFLLAALSLVFAFLVAAACSGS